MNDDSVAALTPGDAGGASAAPNDTRGTMLLVFVAGIVAGFVAMNAIPVGVFHDDGQYVILARSLAEHGTYRFDNIIGAPPGVHYPPGFPAVLALVWLAIPGSVDALRYVNVLLAGGAAVAVFAFVRAAFALSDRAAAATAIAVAACAPMLWLNSLLISETLFVLVLYATLWRALERRDDPVAIGALAGATALVRSLGDPLGLVLVIDRLVRREWRAAGLLAVSWLVVLAPWKIWLAIQARGFPGSIAGAYGEYFAWWREAFAARGVSFVTATVTRNVGELANLTSVMGWQGVPVLQWCAAMLLIAVACIGWWHARARLFSVFAFAGAYVAMMLVWPFSPDRFVWMLLPVLVGGVTAGALRVADRVRGRAWSVRGPVLAGAALVAAGLLAMHGGAAVRRPWERGLAERGAKGLAAGRLIAKLPPRARVASDFDEVAHLHTGRPVLPALGLTALSYVEAVPDSVAAQSILGLITAYDVTHIVVADVPTLQAVQWLRAHGHTLVPVAADSAGAIAFERRPPQ